MFSKASSKSTSAEGAAARPAPTIISSDMRVHGDLKSHGDLQVDGIVEGNITSYSVSIGRTARIEGDIIAETVRVWGRVDGQIQAREVALMESADITGDILHDVLEIERGAVFDGQAKCNARKAREATKTGPVGLVVGGNIAALPGAAAQG